MKPVSGKRKAEVDEEGYERPIPDEGVEMEEEMRWSTKDWVAKVEEIYWSGLPTPPSSPNPNSSNVVKGEDRLGTADQLAEKIIEEACGEDEEKRANFLRATFAKVEGDVLGGEGGVTHEAVKW